MAIPSVMGFAISIAVGIVIVGFMAFAGTDILHNLETTNAQRNGTTNESFTVTANNSNQQVANVELTGVSAMANQTCNIVNGGTNFSVLYTVANTNNNSITFTGGNSGCPAYAAGIVYNVSYNYKVVDTELNAIRNSSSGILQLTRQLPNIGLVAGIAILITLLIGAFAFARRDEGGL